MEGGRHPSTMQQRKGPVWDPFVRLFHWSLAAAFTVAWFTPGLDDYHVPAGKFLLGLVIFRAAWGIVGPASARFETFIKGPATTLGYLWKILCGKPPHVAGHNPAGAAMIGLLLITIAITSASGILMSTTAFWGGVWIEWIHGTSAWIAVLLIAGHLAGVIIGSLQHWEFLPASMVTGRKLVRLNEPRYLGPATLRWGRILVASAVVLLCAGTWAGSEKLFNASLWRMPKVIAAAAKSLNCDIGAIDDSRFIINGGLHFAYRIEVGGTKVRLAIPLATALERRPVLDTAELAKWCRIKADRAEAAVYILPDLRRATTISSAITRNTDNLFSVVAFAKPVVAPTAPVAAKAATPALASNRRGIAERPSVAASKAAPKPPAKFKKTVAVPRRAVASIVRQKTLRKKRRSILGLRPASAFEHGTSKSGSSYGANSGYGPGSGTSDSGGGGNSGSNSGGNSGHGGGSNSGSGSNNSGNSGGGNSGPGGGGD
jgi:cytochrome b